jgi:hypothetical protein
MPVYVTVPQPGEWSQARDRRAFSCFMVPGGHADSHNEKDYAVRSRRIIHIELGRSRRKPADQVITRVFGVWCQWADGGSTEPARERRLFHHEDGPSNN